MTDSDRSPDLDQQFPDVDLTAPIANADGVAVTPFVQLAAVMERNPLEDLALEVNKAVMAVMDSENPKPVAEVTLKLTIARSTQALGMIVMTPEVKSKLPKEPKFGTLLFASDEGVLSTRDPNQKDMFSRPKGVK
jgi:hypothetical protein